MNIQALIPLLHVLGFYVPTIFLNYLFFIGLIILVVMTAFAAALPSRLKIRVFEKSGYPFFGQMFILSLKKILIPS